MTAAMATRIRLLIDTTDTIRRALRRRVHKLNLESSSYDEVSISDFVNDVLQRELAREIAEVEKQQPKRKKDE